MNLSNQKTNYIVYVYLLCIKLHVYIIFNKILNNLITILTFKNYVYDNYFMLKDFLLISDN